MNIDLNRYRNAIKPVCRAFTEREKDTSHEDICARIAVATDCPIIAVTHYMAELYGMTPDLQSFLGRLIAFYKVDQVLNQEPFKGDV